MCCSHEARTPKLRREEEPQLSSPHTSSNSALPPCRRRLGSTPSLPPRRGGDGSFSLSSSSWAAAAARARRVFLFLAGAVLGGGCGCRGCGGCSECGGCSSCGGCNRWLWRWEWAVGCGDPHRRHLEVCDWCLALAIGAAAAPEAAAAAAVPVVLSEKANLPIIGCVL